MRPTRQGPQGDDAGLHLEHITAHEHESQQLRSALRAYVSHLTAPVAAAVTQQLLSETADSTNLPLPARVSAALRVLLSKAGPQYTHSAPLPTLKGHRVPQSAEVQTPGMQCVQQQEHIGLVLGSSESQVRASCEPQAVSMGGIQDVHLSRAHATLHQQHQRQHSQVTEQQVDRQMKHNLEQHQQLSQPQQFDQILEHHHVATEQQGVAAHRLDLPVLRALVQGKVSPMYAQDYNVAVLERSSHCSTVVSERDGGLLVFDRLLDVHGQRGSVHGSASSMPWQLPKSKLQSGGWVQPPAGTQLPKWEEESLHCSSFKVIGLKTGSLQRMSGTGMTASQHSAANAGTRRRLDTDTSIDFPQQQGSGSEAETVSSDSSEDSNSEEDVAKALMHLLRNPSCRRVPRGLAAAMVQLLQLRCTSGELLRIAAAPRPTQQQTLQAATTSSLNGLLEEHSMMQQQASLLKEEIAVQSELHIRLQADHLQLQDWMQKLQGEAVAANDANNEAVNAGAPTPPAAAPGPIGSLSRHAHPHLTPSILSARYGAAQQWAGRKREGIAPLPFSNSRGMAQNAARAVAGSGGGLFGTGPSSLGSPPTNYLKDLLPASPLHPGSFHSGGGRAFARGGQGLPRANSTNRRVSLGGPAADSSDAGPSSDGGTELTFAYSDSDDVRRAATVATGGHLLTLGAGPLMGVREHMSESHADLLGSHAFEPGSNCLAGQSASCPLVWPQMPADLRSDSPGGSRNSPARASPCCVASACSGSGSSCSMVHGGVEQGTAAAAKKVTATCMCVVM